MSTNQVEKILDIYKQLSQNPAITSAKIIPTKKSGIKIESVWSQRNLERRKKQKFTREFVFDAELELLSESFPSDISSEVLRTSSKDDNVRAVLRELTIDGKIKQFIEIWDDKHVVKSYDLCAFDIHGEVYSDSTFSTFELSPDNERLLYIAEKKLKKNEPFYKQKSKSENKKSDDDEEISRGTEYIYKPDWGEQLVGKHQSVVVVLNINKDTIKPITSIPNDYFPGEATWAPNGVDIVGTAYKLHPRYVGLVFCSNRPSYIFHLKDNEFCLLTSEGISCRSPRFSPDGQYLAWLERNVSPPHDHVKRLMYLKWNTLETPNILIDTINDNVIISKNKKFYGIYNQNLPKRCWSEDSKYIFFNTVKRSTIYAYIVNLDSKLITEIENSDKSSLTVLDINKNYVTFTKFTPIQPPQLMIGKFEPTASDIGQLHLKKCTNPLVAINKHNLMYENVEFIHDNNDTIKDFNFTYLGKKGEVEKSVPVILMLHGGPHSVFCNDFILSHVVLASLGFGILLINYRGSLGMGGNNVDYLLGKIGKSDVLDCTSTINFALHKYPWLDPKKINLCGGSYGGFMCAQLSGQYPEMFKSVVMRNPVIDVASMFSISDIPDWCTAETGNSQIATLPENTPKSNYSELLTEMVNYSPILHADKVKAPTLIALGSNDLRVPASQGKLWYYHLSANNITTKLHMYDDNHSLAKDEVEIDFVINTALWIMKYNEKL